MNDVQSNAEGTALQLLLTFIAPRRIPIYPTSVGKTASIFIASSYVGSQNVDFLSYPAAYCVWNWLLRWSARTIIESCVTGGVWGGIRLNIAGISVSICLGRLDRSSEVAVTCSSLAIFPVIRRYSIASGKTTPPSLFPTTLYKSATGTPRNEIPRAASDCEV
jgi:hypothetical protein